MVDPKKISTLIKTQFPSFYREDGPVFIDFVTAYYEWLESQTPALKSVITLNKSTVAVLHKSPNVVGTNTYFTSDFSNGDSIAVYRNDNEYEIFTINVVANDTFLTLSTSKLPEFSYSNALYGNTWSRPNPGYYARRTLDSLDIDKTSDEFVVWFKEQYLKNIQFETVTDTRRLIKNSLDLYRSKGTPRSVDLLFRATFGVPAEVYYPATDLFKLSSGKWTIPKYLELSPSEWNIALRSKQIVGQTSGATAFCDEIVRKVVKNKIIDVAYISAIRGRFETGETINTEDFAIDKELASWIVGSLNEVIITNGGEGYSIGDIVTFTANTGQSGKARVANTANSPGSIIPTILNGGYGYQANSEVIISEKILKIEGITTNATKTSYFERGFESIYQPTANIIYSSANGTLAIGDDIYTYYANGSQMGYGAILNLIAVNSTYGEFQLKTLSGDLNNTTIYTTSNTISATVDTYTNTTAYANVVGSYPNVIIQVSSISGTFEEDEIVTTGLGGNGKFYLLTNTAGSNGTIVVINTTSAYHPTNTITGQTSGATATIDKIDLEFGVYNINNSFITTENNYVYSTTYDVNGSISFVSSGEGFSFSISNNFLYTEYIDYATDYISTNTTHYLNVALNATQFDFPADTAGNLTSNTIANLLSYSNTQIGRLQTISGIAPGESYNRIPVIRVYDRTISGYKHYDRKILSVSNATASFAVGEVVTQSAQSFRGLVESANSSEVVATRMRFYSANDALPTTNSTTFLVGEDSGAVANVDFVASNTISNFIGDDAEFTLSVAIANGVASNLEIIDSGFGYVQNETIRFGNNGTAVANLYTHGTGSGFYQSKDGFLSSTKKLYDAHYWQTHSYEVRASVVLDKYKDMLKKVVHVAGTRFFGNLVHSATAIVAANQVSNTGSNTVITSTITSNSFTDRFGTFLFDRNANYITTRV